MDDGDGKSAEEALKTLRQESCIHSSFGCAYCVVWVMAIDLAATKDRQVGMSSASFRKRVSDS